MRYFRTKIIDLYLILIVIVLFVIVGVYKITRPDSIIPASINSQLNYQPLLPEIKGQNTTIQKSSIKYDSKQKILSFNAFLGTNKVTITEQAYPEILIYDKLVGTLNEYSEMQTKAGKVALTRPKTLNGGQTAVLSTYNGTSGVLLFAKPDKNMTNDQWQVFFNNLSASR